MVPARHSLSLASRRFSNMDTLTKPPPPFGHQLRQYFGFEEDYVNLNNGQHSVAPKNRVGPALALIFFWFRFLRLRAEPSACCH
jgi:hypothetical protein